MGQTREYTVSKRQVSDYVFKTLTKPRKELGGMPICPFIHQHRHNISILQNKDPLKFAKHYKDLQHIFRYYAVVLFGFAYSYDRLDKITKQINRVFKDSDLIALMMHPDGEESVLPLEYNFHAPLLIIQQKKRLEDSRHKLKKTKYYKYYK
jgi:hypothetical protein